MFHNIWYKTTNNLGGFMKDIILNDKIKIEDMIYEIRGKQVILDRDLAKL